jgi:hypothetical protein
MQYMHVLKPLRLARFIHPHPITSAGANCDADGLAVIKAGALASASAPEWEHRLGGLRVSRAIMQADCSEDTFDDATTAVCTSLLEDPEVRVRWAVGELLHALAQRDGAACWDRAVPAILASIRANFDRDAAEPSGQLPAAPSIPTHEDSSPGADFVSALLERSYRAEPAGTGDMRHGTEGWKCLETSFRALQHIMEGCGPDFAPRLDDDLRRLVYKALLHPNRFVREACHFILATMCRLLAGQRLIDLGPELARKLGLGLSDNWSQVRAHHMRTI